MDYVMVPVPEELAPKVVRYIGWKGDPNLRDALEGSGDPAGSRESGAEEAQDPVARVLGRLDDHSRRLLAFVARGSLDGRDLGVPAAAAFAGLSEREMIGAIVEINVLMASDGGPPLTVLIKNREREEDVPFTWDERVVVMPEEVARSVADLLGASAEP